MPRIPSQTGRKVLPQGGGGGGGGRGGMGSMSSRGIAAGAGGEAQAGAAIAAGGAQLGAAFAYAQRERDRINAHLDSLNQRTGAYRLAMDGATGIDEDTRNLLDQVSKQQGNDPSTWRVKIKNQEGEDIEVLPEDGMKILMQNRIDQGVNDAGEFYGTEARMHVAGALTRDAMMVQSKFGDALIRLKHEKQLADFQTVANRLEAQAADPGNKFRESAKQDLDDHIQSAVTGGIIAPTDGVKLKETMKASIGDKYWTAQALRNPVSFLEMVNTRSSHAEAHGAEGESMGGTVVPGGLQKLPEDLPADKLEHYTQIAFGALQREQAKTDRIEKEHEKRLVATQKKTFSDNMGVLLSGGSVSDLLPQQLHDNELDATQANTLRTVEHTLKVQRADDPGVKQASVLALNGFTKEITQARFGMGNLDEIETNLNAAVAAGHMLPQDAQVGYTQLREAQGYQVSEQKETKNKEVQAAKSHIKQLLTTAGPMDKYDSVSEDSKAFAERDYLNYLAKNPNGDPWDFADQVLKRWEPVVAERKKMMGDSPEQVKLDDAKMQSAVQRGVMSRAAYKEWKRQGDTWRQIYKNALEAQQHPPPEPSFMEKLRTFGSSLFQDPEAEAGQ